MKEGEIFDVAIVGMGPVGCTAALFCARAGLKVLAIEQEPAVYQLPRAVSLDGEIVRNFQRIGLAQAVANLLQPARPGERAGFCDAEHNWLFGQDSVEFGPNGWAPNAMFDQPELEGFLRERALAEPQVVDRVGWRLDAHKAQSDHLRLTLSPTTASGSENKTVHARYLLACDGASSPVRRRLGIEWQDLGYDCDWLVVDVETLPGHTLSNEVLQVCDPDRLHTYVATKDPYRRWEFRLNPGERAEAMLDDSVIESLIAPWTPPGTWRLRRKAVYQFHAAVARRWRSGRIFLAGDAAHQSPPFIGQGMNAGMRDAINLAWKLPLVIGGHCSNALLDSYEAERYAHAHDLVEWAVSFGRLMEHIAAVERAKRNGQPEPSAPRAEQSVGYGQGRAAPPLRAGALIREQVSDTGATGYLLRQPMVKTQTGNLSTRLDDLLGSGFALIGRTAADLEVGPQQAELLERLRARRVALDRLSIERGQLDRVFSDHNAVLLRPDRYVFGHSSDALSTNALVDRLAEALGLH